LIGWLKNLIWGVPRALAAGILQLIDDAVSGVTNWVQSIWDWVTGTVANLVAWITYTINFFDQWIAQVIGWADTMMRDLYNKSVALASGWVIDARNFAQGLYNFTVGHIADVFNWAQAAFADVYRWTQHAVFDVLARAINDARDFVTQVVIPGIVATLGAYINDAYDYAKSVFATLANAYNHVFDPIADLINVVRAAWKWLTWMATHGFDAVHDLIFGGWGISGKDLLGGIVNRFLQHGDEAEAIIARWIFGSILLPCGIIKLLALSPRIRRRIVEY
jgi:phage-related protein